MLDCIVVGGGPAGLTAALYLARFRLKVRVIDAGRGRAGLIPRTRNHAGFPEGISGQDLIERMRAHADKYGAAIGHGVVERIDRSAEGFTVGTGEGEVLEARTILLATGVTNRRPPMSEAFHAEAVAKGRLRYCPICDGYEVIDQNVAVVGTGEHGMREARFLRSYTPRVTLVAPDGPHDLDASNRRELAALGIDAVDGPARDFQLSENGVSFLCGDGRRSFDTAYPAMGSAVHSDLAVRLGADTESLGCIKVDRHQRTSVPWLYAAGDVVAGLDQISHCIGEGGVAATAIRNDLAQAN